jgi:hypothetical protein
MDVNKWARHGPDTHEREKLRHKNVGCLTCVAHGSVPATPIHRALSVNEVLWTITRQLEFHFDRRTLFTLALTNRALSDVALDALWEEPSLWDLAQRMDGRLWEVAQSFKAQFINDPDVQRPTLVSLMQRGPSPDKALSLSTQTFHMRDGVSYDSLGDRFLTYSKRVRKLVLESHKSIITTSTNQASPIFEVPPAVILVWANSRPDKLSTRLKEFILTWEYDALLRIGPEATLNSLASTVTHLYLYWPANMSPDKREYDRRRGAFKNVVHLTFTTSMGNMSPIEDFAQTLTTASTNLHTGAVRVSLSMEAVLHLSTIRLVSLDLELSAEDVSTQSLPTSAFAELQRLKLADKEGRTASFQLFLLMKPTGRLRSFGYQNRALSHDFPRLYLLLEHVARFKTLDRLVLMVNTKVAPISLDNYRQLFGWLHHLPELKRLAWAAHSRDGVNERIACDLFRACTKLDHWAMFDDAPWHLVVSM